MSDQEPDVQDRAIGDVVALVQRLGTRQLLRCILIATGWRPGPKDCWWWTQSDGRQEAKLTLEGALQRQREWEDRHHARAGEKRPRGQS